MSANKLTRYWSFVVYYCLLTYFCLQMKMWDVQKKKCVGVLTGHRGSVKSMCSHPTNSGKLFFCFFMYHVANDSSICNFVLTCLMFNRSGCFWFERRVLCSMGFKMQVWPWPEQNKVSLTLFILFPNWWCSHWLIHVYYGILLLM